MKKILISILSASLLATPLITAVNKGVNDIKSSVNMSKMEQNYNAKAIAAGWNQPYAANSQSGTNMGNLMYISVMHFFQIFLAGQFAIGDFSSQSQAGMQKYIANAATAYKYAATNVDLSKGGTVNDFLFSTFTTTNPSNMSILQMVPTVAPTINAGFTGWTYTAAAGSVPSIDTSKGTVQPTNLQVAEVITGALIGQVILAGSAPQAPSSLGVAITQFAKDAFNKTISFAGIITQFASVLPLLVDTSSKTTVGDFNPLTAKKEITAPITSTGAAGSAYIQNTLTNIPNPLDSTGALLTQNNTFVSNSLDALSFYVAELFLSFTDQTSVTDPKQQMQIASIKLLTNYVNAYSNNNLVSIAFSNQFISNNVSLLDSSTPVQWGTYTQFIYGHMGSSYQFQTQKNETYTFNSFAFGSQASVFPLSKLSNWNNISGDQSTANSNLNNMFTVSATNDFYKSQLNYSNSVAQYWTDVNTGMTSYLKNANTSISNSILFQLENNLTSNQLISQFNVDNVNNGTASYFKNFNSISNEMDFAFISGNKLTAGVIAGFVVGIIAAFGAGAVATYFFIKNKKSKTSSIKK